MKTEDFGRITFTSSHPGQEEVTFTVPGDITITDLREVFGRFLLAAGYSPKLVWELDDDTQE